MSHSQAKPARSQLVAHLLSAAWVIVGVSVATVLLERAGFLDRFETTGLDAFNVLRRPIDPSDVVLLGITDADYGSLFNETSPLACEPLKRGGERRPTFAWSVVQRGCIAECDTCCRAAMSASPEDGLRLNFAGERFNFKPLSVQFVLDAAANSHTPGSVWGTQGLLTQKIVLLGGYYRQARDTEATAIGSISGLQINAQAIESELHGGGIRPMNRWLEFTFDLLAGCVIVIVNYRLRTRLARALGLSVLLVPVLCLVASFLAFSAFALWFNFVPVVVSVIVHQFYQHAREYQRLARAEARG